VNRLQSLMARPSRSFFGQQEYATLVGGLQYALGGGLTQTLGTKIEDIDVGYSSLAYRAYASNPVVFACMRVRRDLFTEARFGYQNMRGGVAGDFYGDRERPNSGLSILDHPWPGATTGDLLKYMILDNDLAGNAFVARKGRKLVRLRPDWTQMIHGTPEPDGNMWVGHGSSSRRARSPTTRRPRTPCVRCAVCRGSRRSCGRSWPTRR
jgi:hypothetical protein